MSSSVQFVIAIIGLLLLVMIWRLGGLNWLDYFKTKTGLGILKGIVLAVLFAVVLALATGCSGGSYLNDASVFAGLDMTKKPSPSCEEGTHDDQTTSNLGLRGNLYQSADERFRTNLKYTHHSCALSPDAAQYDAVGLELEYKLWSR